MCCMLNTLHVSSRVVANINESYVLFSLKSLLFQVVSLLCIIFTNPLTFHWNGDPYIYIYSFFCTKHLVLSYSIDTVSTLIINVREANSSEGYDYIAHMDIDVWERLLNLITHSEFQLNPAILNGLSGMLKTTYYAFSWRNFWYFYSSVTRISSWGSSQ